MSIRCASCGSGKVSVDTKSEGFSVGKAVVGTALFGTVGAVMGVNGKQKKYYHCADCGMTLSYSLEQKVSATIDLYLNHPDEHRAMLEIYKEMYPNIEWELNSVVENNVSKPILKKAEDYVLHPRILSDKMYEYCISNNRLYIEKEELMNAIIRQNDVYKNIDKKRTGFGTYDSGKISKDFKTAIDDLCSKGLATIEIEDDSKYYLTLYTNPKDIKSNIKEYRFSKDAEIISKIVRDYCLSIYCELLKENNDLPEDNATELIAQKLTDIDLISDIDLARKVVYLVCRYVRTQTMRNRNKYKTYIEFLTAYLADKNASAEDAFNSIKKLKEEERYKDIDYVEEQIFKVLTDDTIVLTTSEFAEKNIELSKVNDLFNVLYNLVRYGELEGKLEGKDHVFGLIGSIEKTKEIKIQEQRKAEQREKERKRQEIRNQISELEKEKSENEKIYAENKGKIFGAGAKAKKSAQMRIAELETQINSLKSKL